MSVLLILLLVSFPLGHLVRLEVAQGIAVYPNDLIAGLMAMVVIAKALKTKSSPRVKNGRTSGAYDRFPIPPALDASYRSLLLYPDATD